MCANCDGTIKDWSEDIQDNTILQREAWCSWCFERCNHVMEKRNIVRRSTYNCDRCGLKTLPCMMCDIGMTRGGPAWDDSICANCSRETGKGGWEDLKAKLEAMMAQLRSKERVTAELVC